LLSKDMEMEQGRRAWEEDSWADYEEERRREARREEQRRVIGELEEQTALGRERAAELKRRREEQANSKREKLKAEFLKRHVAALKAAKAKEKQGQQRQQPCRELGTC
jgi:hypothetical protein